MNRGLFGAKRHASMSIDQVEVGNASWWNQRPMDYDWHGHNSFPPGSTEWFDQMDAILIHAQRLFATEVRPFDLVIPLDALAGRHVLEIGCGMGLHAEIMASAGAILTAVDLTPTAVEMTRRRFALKGLQAEIQVCDAERLPFPDGQFDFVWSWGVIHHSARTGRIVRQIARVLRPDGECRVMVYNRNGVPARLSLLANHLLKLGFLWRSPEETLFRATDGFSSRYYVQDQFEDVFRAFFAQVTSTVCGQDADVLPLPRQLRRPLLSVVPASYQRAAQARRGGFIFLEARRPL